MNKILNNFTEMRHPSNARFIIIINKYHIVFLYIYLYFYLYTLLYSTDTHYIDIINFSLSQYMKLYIECNRS